MDKTEADARRQLYEELLEVKGGSIELGIERDPKEVAERPDHFVSAEAFDSMMQHITSWIGSRMVRRHNARNVGVGKLQVTVTVRMDDEDPETTEVARFPVIDGSHRRAGA